MYKKMLCLLASTVISTTLASSDAPRCHLPSHTLLTAFYYPNNTIVTERGLATYQNAIAHLDVINYSSSLYGINYNDGKFQLTSIAGQNLITLQQLIKKNKFSALVFLSLGRWSSKEMHKVFSDNKTADAFINAVVDVVKNKNFGLSGIDIDWENFFSPRANEVKAFPTLIKKLRTALDAAGLKDVCISLDLPVSPVFGKKYPAPSGWLPYVDWANIMAYEYYGINPAHTELDGTLGTVTAAYAGKTPTYPSLSIADSLTYYIKEAKIPKQKLVVALPFYGNLNYTHDADKANQFGLRQKVIDTRSIITMDYSEIYSKYGIFQKAKGTSTIHEYTFETPDSVRGTHAFWSTRLLAESKEFGKSYNFVSYPDPIAIKEITLFVKQQGCLGLSAWQMDYDLPFDNKDSLLNTMYTAINKY